MITDVVIMAGGIGERLWPASTPVHPKQFFRLNDDLSFFQSSLLRALALDVPGKIVIVTRRNLVDECARQCIDLYLKLENDSVKELLLTKTVVIGEICARHTLAALMTGITWIKGADMGLPEPVSHTVLSITCDHVMENSVAFLNDCEYASWQAEKGRYVLFGIKPDSASTDYGYIHAVENLEQSSHAYKVEGFYQKPEKKAAQKFLENGGYWWNSGMLCFDLDSFLTLVEKHTPATYEVYQTVFGEPLPKTTKITEVDTVKTWPCLDALYSRLDPLDVDREISQKAENCAMMEVHFSWTDIGSWDSLARKTALKQTATVVYSNSYNNLVYSDIPVMLCGVDDLIIVQKEGKLLVLKKGQSGLLKDAVEQFKLKDSLIDDTRR